MSGDRRALEELFRVSPPGVPHLVTHYLYSPTRDAAEETAATLRSHAFTALVQPAALGGNWVILASHQLVPSEDQIAAARRLMELLAGRIGGEYDGWEAEVVMPGRREH